MATETQSRGTAMRELISVELYKRSQGRRLRQLTFAGIGLFVLWGLKSLSDQLLARKPDWMGAGIFGRWPLPRTTCDLIAYGAPALLAALAFWAVFRLVNWPRFADFLIATEAEMAKVSWSTKSELKRATVVVLLALFLLAGFLFAMDAVWVVVLEQIGVLQKRSAQQSLLDWRILPESLGLLRCAFS